MIKVCAYCRVSTDSSDQANSFENQQSYFNRELSRNPEYTLVDIYADKGITGTKLKRKEFDRMLVDAGLDIIKVSNDAGYLKYITLPSARVPKFNYIFVKNSSRFARNVEVESIFRDLAKKGVYVYFLDLMKSTENEADRTYIQIFCSFDERESRDRRTKVLFGIEEGNQRGVIRTNGKIYGYKYIKKENRLVIIEKEAAVIRKIFALYLSGLGIRQIINTLNSEGITTRQGKSFCKNSILRILDNEKYAGFRNNCKHSIGNDLFDKFSYPHRKEDGEYLLDESDRIPPIIDSETFFKCRELRYGKVNHATQKGIRRPITKYAGLIYCENCRQAYTSNVDRGRHFYNCKTKKQHGTKACNNPNVSLVAIENALQEFLENSATITEQAIDTQCAYWYAYGRYIIENEHCHDEELEQLRAEQEELLYTLDGLYDLFAKKRGTQDLLQRKIETTEKRIKRLETRISALATDDDFIIQKIRVIQEKINEIRSLKRNFETIEDLLDYVILYVSYDRKISVRFKSFHDSEKFAGDFDENMQVFGNLTEPEKNERVFKDFCSIHDIVS